jgi:hypothetical protein
VLAILLKLKLKTKCVISIINEAAHIVSRSWSVTVECRCQPGCRNFPLMTIIIGDELPSRFFDLIRASIISHLSRMGRRESIQIRMPAECRILIPNFAVNDVVTQS